LDQNTLTGIAIMGGGAIVIFIAILFDRVWPDLQVKLKNSGVKFEYQLELICGMIMMGVVCVIFIPVIGGILHNMLGLVGFGVAAIYPLVVMYLRPSVFGEKMQLITTDLRIYRVFLVFSVMAGGYFTILSFSMLNSHFPIGLVLTFLILGLFAQTVPLYFDIFDRILPVDLGMNRKRPMDPQDAQKAMAVIGAISVATFICIRFIAFTIQAQLFGI
jgi:hypothetical protein